MGHATQQQNMFQQAKSEFDLNKTHMPQFLNCDDKLIEIMLLMDTEASDLFLFEYLPEFKFLMTRL